MLIRDGTVYFLTVLAMNIAQLVVFQILEQVYLISFICTLTPVLISRFFLDLREAARGGVDFAELQSQNDREHGSIALRELKKPTTESPCVKGSSSQGTSVDVREV